MLSWLGPEMSVAEAIWLARQHLRLAATLESSEKAATLRFSRPRREDVWTASCPSSPQKVLAQEGKQIFVVRGAEGRKTKASGRRCRN